MFDFRVRSLWPDSLPVGDTGAFFTLFTMQSVIDEVLVLGILCDKRLQLLGLSTVPSHFVAATNKHCIFIKITIAISDFARTSSNLKE